VLASAGAFEGVSGKIEVADLLNMKSAPGQKLTIEKVTLGMPLEKGVIDFQLIGFEAIRIAGAEWPFVGGFIRVKPTDFTFASTARNVIVAQAVDWNLDTLVRQFELPDLKLQGKVGGDFPVVFSAGSAEIDNAVLASSGPGVIQYGGAATDAAAQNEPTTAIVMDALKNFRFEVLKIGLDGNLAGKMILTLDMLGRNPAVMNGQAFQLNISIDSELAKLVNSLTLGTDIQGAIRETRENGQGERQ
jgi:translocation and assembly module TamB